MRYALAFAGLLISAAPVAAQDVHCILVDYAFCDDTGCEVRHAEPRELVVSPERGIIGRCLQGREEPCPVVYAIPATDDAGTTLTPATASPWIMWAWLRADQRQLVTLEPVTALGPVRPVLGTYACNPIVR